MDTSIVINTGGVEQEKQKRRSRGRERGQEGWGRRKRGRRRLTTLWSRKKFPNVFRGAQENS